jgi:hypothetical protein
MNAMLPTQQPELISGQWWSPWSTCSQVCISPEEWLPHQTVAFSLSARQCIYDGWIYWISLSCSSAKGILIFNLFIMFFSDRLSSALFFYSSW